MKFDESEGKSRGRLWRVERETSRVCRCLSEFFDASVSPSDGSELSSKLK